MSSWRRPWVDPCRGLSWQVQTYIPSTLTVEGERFELVVEQEEPERKAYLRRQKGARYE